MIKKDLTAENDKESDSVDLEREDEGHHHHHHDHDHGHEHPSDTAWGKMKDQIIKKCNEHDKCEEVFRRSLLNKHLVGC